MLYLDQLGSRERVIGNIDQKGTIRLQQRETRTLKQTNRRVREELRAISTDQIIQDFDWEMMDNMKLMSKVLTNLQVNVCMMRWIMLTSLMFHNKIADYCNI